MGAAPGRVAEGLRSGLQNRLRRFNSGRGLHSLSPEPATPAPTPVRALAVIATARYRGAVLCYAISSCCYAVRHYVVTTIPAYIDLRIIRIGRGDLDHHDHSHTPFSSGPRHGPRRHFAVPG